MNIGNSRIVASCVVALILAFMNRAPAQPSTKPPNYDQIKATLDVYATADDMMDDKLIAARESLRGKGEEAVPALIELFKANTSDQYRAAIVDALHYNRGDKAVASAFFGQQLESSADSWQGQIWIAAAIKFLATHDANRGRSVSRKALDAKNDFIKQAAVGALGAVGNRDDIGALQTFASREKHSNPPKAKDALVEKSEEAVKQITRRSP